MPEMPEMPQEAVYTAETSTTPGAMPSANPTAEQMQALASDPMATSDDMGELKERAAFETFVQNSGNKIPENFQDAGAWFDSLKEAQKQYTQGQQEIADLKREYSENNVSNPNYNPTPETTQGTETEEGPNPELRISSPEESEIDPVLTGITEEDWQSWGLEVAVHGDISPETRDEIKQKGGFTDAIIDDFLDAQKAKMREAYGGAAKIVGGRDNLDHIFKWAANNLSYEEQVQINVGLAGPAYEVTLRGLNEMYSKAIGAEAKAKEPGTLPGRQPLSESQNGYVGYKTKREFYADRNNPRFKLDNSFRDAVQQRMLRTDYNTLKD